ncbi:hypothetical protein BGZ76_008194 [Entomortierella beljakovae]|nr:hypothetical protein BGZ76_008194 [Entomortierella beljakovae]
MKHLVPVKIEEVCQKLLQGKMFKKVQEYLAQQYIIGMLTALSEDQQLIESEEGVHVNTETIQKYLKQEGLKAYVKRKKPQLTE